MPGLTFEQRLFAKILIDRDDPDACWMWAAATDGGGYGHIRRDGRMIRAHRATYEVYRGTIPPGMFLDHICRVKRCVNPEHLRVTTHKQNHENRAGANKNNRSGVRGAHWRKDIGRWQVRVRHNGRLHFGGFFDSIDEAAEAARALRNQLFTHNNGDRTETDE